MRTETAINALIQRSGGTPQPEDYFGADGLLYCGKCNTPKQAFLRGTSECRFWETATR